MLNILNTVLLFLLAMLISILSFSQPGSENLIAYKKTIQQIKNDIKIQFSIFTQHVVEKLIR